METNIIKAIINIVNNPIFELKEYYKSKTRANSMGEALEEYIKDIFAGTINEMDEEHRLKKISDFFSYLGNQNNPPDCIIKNGDAIEVKKIESKNASLALNSSYPKSKLFSNSHMITEECRGCEQWEEKDILYVVGAIKSNMLSSLSMVYGVDYAANFNIYERIKTVISTGISSISNVEFSETKELGRVNRVDPLGITNLRIRGMWHIENPIKVFKYIYKYDVNNSFNFMCIINYEKYQSFDLEDRRNLESLLVKVSNFEMKDVFIKDPNNPSKLKSAKLITYWRE